MNARPTNITNAHGQVILSGRGLEPIVDHARRHDATRVRLIVEGRRASMRVTFGDGARCDTEHDDADALRDVVARSNWASGARIVIHSKA